MGIGEKIKQFRQDLGLGQAELADVLGVKQNDVSKAENNQKKFIPNSYIKLLMKNNYDINTLFNDDLKLKKLDNGSGKVAEEAQTYLRRTDKLQKKQMIPLFNLEASAGLVELFQHVGEKTPIDYLSIPNLPKCDGAVFVTGDSMYPLLKSGDIIIYKQIHNIDDDLFWGEMYLVSVALQDEEYISVKYVQKSDKGNEYVKLVSQNGHHQPKDIPKKRIRAIAIVKASVRINSMR
ncbi:helix-turn-helix domain-containing protein [Cellulophaga lytica]|uniref:helix-turn-helix domain-containing protein n=1 Tax=Cellulophaga lytica TaxID=979 RepID=UPI003CE5C2FD